jgi:hypothetical protein
VTAPIRQALRDEQLRHPANCRESVSANDRCSARSSGFFKPGAQLKRRIINWGDGFRKKPDEYRILGIVVAAETLARSANAVGAQRPF